MKTADFDYELPAELIAQVPLEPRDASRLLVVHRTTGQVEHRQFRNLPEYLRKGDLLVANQSRVIPARLFGRKVVAGGQRGGGSGGKVELLLLNRRDEHTWEALVRGKGLRPGRVVELPFPEDAGAQSPVRATIEKVTPSGTRLIRFDARVEDWLWGLGEVPLPPYIHEPLADPERYQTVYSRTEGSAAAPTAGLHFTPELLLALRESGVDLAFVTLHIGLDTFQPVREEEVEAHQIHTEWCEVTPEVARQVNQARLAGGRVVAVGTTVVRTLESAASGCAVAIDGEESEPRACGWRTVMAFRGSTELFIVPGYRFRATDVLLTNFHLPRSTLLMLVSAFAGRSLILRAYEEAKREGYRFYSFGDAMLIL